MEKKENNQQRLRVFFIALLMLIVHSNSNAQSVWVLNDYLDTYVHNFKVNNPHEAHSSYECTNYICDAYAELKSNYLILTFEYKYNIFANNSQGRCTYEAKLKINLSTATFYIGSWRYESILRGLQEKWINYGPETKLTIEDKNGMDITIKDYNSNTRKNLIDKICFDLGTTPVANKIIDEIYNIQQHFKEKEPWLLPEPKPEPKPESKPEPKVNNSTKGNNGNTSKTNETKTSTPKKVGKYVQ